MGGCGYTRFPVVHGDGVLVECWPKRRGQSPALRKPYIKRSRVIVTPKRLVLSKVLWVLLFLVFAVAAAAQEKNSARLGAFDASGDVGTVLHAGSAEYDAAKGTYTIAGSGENMWFAKDAYQFVWKKMSGDLGLSADISFAGSGGNAHRKAVLMIRQSLDEDSVYVDIARHGNGMAALQFRA